MTERDPREEYEFYEDEENLRPQGPPRRRESGLTEMLPVRVSSSLMDALRDRAKREERSVSWVVRRATERYLDVDGGQGPEEEARFWDETSVDELEDGELEEVEVERPERPLSATIAVRLDEATVRTLRAIAEEKGVGVTQLIRSWTMERLRRERRRWRVPTADVPAGPIRFRLERALEDLIPEAVERALQGLSEPSPGDDDAR